MYKDGHYTQIFGHCKVLSILDKIRRLTICVSFTLIHELEQKRDLLIRVVYRTYRLTFYLSIKMYMNKEE